MATRKNSAAPAWGSIQLPGGAAPVGQPSSKPSKIKPYKFDGSKAPGITKDPVVSNDGGNSGGGGGGSASSTTSTSDADKKAAAKKKADAKAAARAKARAEQKAKNEAAAAAKRNKFNPLLQKFLSPAELRQQAADLAALGSTSEEALRTQSAQQVAGISGLTNALTSRLGAINTQNIAGIAGMGQVYKDIAAQTQSTGGSALAAAGAPTTIAAGGNPMAAANLANLTAQTVGLVPAAGAIGAGFEAAANSNLTKALASRANTISSDTAKYLKQLQDQEYTKATAIETLKQNAALLGVKQDTLGQTADYNAAKIQDMQARQTLGWAKLDAQIAKINADAGKTGATKAASIVDSILAGASALTKPQKGLTGKQQYEVIWDNGKKSKKVFAKNPRGAAWQLRNLIGDADYNSAAYVANPTNKQEFALKLPSRSTVEAQIRARLNNTTMTPSEIESFLITYAGALGLDTLPA